MITILSPAKTLDFTGTSRGVEPSVPSFLEDAEMLISALRKRAPAGPEDRYRERNLAWRREDHTVSGPAKPARPALYAFRGEVFRNLDADSLREEDVSRAQERVRILSALYGILKPLDLILPYRLEMADALETPRGKTLYQFWGTRLADELHRSTDTLVNLASQEYYRALPEKALALRVITPVFRERTETGSRVVGVYAKRQRGRMARFILDHSLDDPEALKGYARDGYAFEPGSSSEREWVFLR